VCIPDRNWYSNEMLGSCIVLVIHATASHSIVAHERTEPGYQVHCCHIRPFSLTLTRCTKEGEDYDHVPDGVLLNNRRDPHTTRFNLALRPSRGLASSYKVYSLLPGTGTRVPGTGTWDCNGARVHPPISLSYLQHREEVNEQV